MHKLEAIKDPLPQEEVAKTNECPQVKTVSVHNKDNNNKPKEKKSFAKEFKCDKCEKKYTWYSGLANHKRFLHNKLKVKQV